MNDSTITYQIKYDTTKATQSARAFSKQTFNIDNGIKNVAKTAAVGAVGIAVASAKMFADFETGMNKTSTLFGNVDVDMNKLKDSILDLSNETGIAATDLNEGLYQALSAGVPITEDAAEAMKFMSTNSKLAVAGFTDVTTAVDATTSIINAYGKSVEDADEVSQILIRTQNLGKTTVGELGNTISNVTPTAAALGVSFEQVGTSLALLTSNGIQTGKATTSLNQLFVELSKSGTKGSEALRMAQEEAGMIPKTFKEMIADGKDLSEIMGLISNHADKNAVSMNDLFGSVEATNAALVIAGNQDKFVDTLNVMESGTDDLGTAFDKVQSSSVKNFTDALNELRNAGIKLGTVVFPILAELATKIADSVSGFEENLEIIENHGGIIEATKEVGGIAFGNALSGDTEGWQKGFKTMNESGGLLTNAWKLFTGDTSAGVSTKKATVAPTSTNSTSSLPTSMTLNVAGQQLIGALSSGWTNTVKLFGGK